MNDSMTTATHSDLDTLLQCVREQGAVIEQQESVIEKKSQVIAEQKRRIAMLEEYLRLERSRRYGPSSEASPDQMALLFNEAEAEEADSEVSDALEELRELNNTESNASGGKRGRKGLSKSLPRHQVHINLSDEEKAGAIDTFYTVVREELDHVPAQTRVIEYMQEKAVFVNQDADEKKGESKRRVVAAPMPRHPLKKCIASIALLAYIVVSKYCDGLSLYGLEKILRRHGGGVTRTTLANWVIRLSQELQPLLNLAREHQLSYDYLQIDETRVQVLKEINHSPHTDEWMWVSKGGPPDKPVVLFDYDPSRGAKVPERLLEGFRGYLQCDGLSSYDVVCKKYDLTQLGCFDHARRKFVDAIKGGGKRKKNQPVSKAEVGLGKINALYRLERNIRDLSPREKYQRRQTLAKPLLENLKRWLEDNLDRTMKDGLTRKAIFYTLNQWEKLVRYCEDGRLNISNAGAENAIRPFAVGRRRWLFCDTPAGARASAIHYSLIETCKANDLNPEVYYRHVLALLPYADSAEKWEALLPWNVKAELEKNSLEGKVG